MDSDFLTYLGWREALLAVVALLVIYILISFLRIGRLKNAAVQQPATTPHSASVAVAAYAAAKEEDMPPSVEPVVEVPAEPPESATAEESRPRERAFAWNEPPQKVADTLRMEALEQDVAQLRRELGGLRAEVQALREEQWRELSWVQVAQNTSSFYSYAMQLALQGQESDDIARLCGISRAEADLVVALARNQDKPLD